MRKRKEEESQPKNSESRELWLDGATLNEVSNTSDKEDNEDSSTEKEDEN